MQDGGGDHNWWGYVVGILTSGWAAAVTGRLVWHTRLVQRGDRKFFSRELLYELPIVAFTYLVGAGIADHLGWTGPSAGATIAVVSYLGPAGLQRAIQLYAGRADPPGGS